MTIDPDIRDQAYQFFIEEVPELLEIIETGLLELRPDVTVQKVHEIMRAAHSIKGGAASVGLEFIKTIAHRLEDAFKALYSDTVVVDVDLETLLLKAYDCLKYPLQTQIETGIFNESQALESFELVFSELEIRLGPALDAADNFMPSAIDLGVDIVASIFEMDVAEVLVQLRAILAAPQSYECGAELQTQLEILTGFAELVEMPGFTSIMATAQTATNQHINQPLPVIEQLVRDVDRVRASVLAGDRSLVSGPSDNLLALADGEIAESSDTIHIGEPIPDQIDDFDLAELEFNVLDEPTNSGLISEPFDTAADQVSTLEEIWCIEAEEFPSVEKIDDEVDLPSPNSADINTLADVWGDAESAATLDVEVADFEAVVADVPSIPFMEETWADLPKSILDELADEGDEPPLDELADQGNEFSRKSSGPKEENVLDHGESALSLISDVYESLPKFSIEDRPVVTSPKKLQPTIKAASRPKLSAKVALERLEQMDNLVGELAINRNSLSLQNDQFQRTVHQLSKRFSSFRTIIKQLQSISDKILVSPERQLTNVVVDSTGPTFDSLEMDSYGEIYSLLEGVLEEVFQLAESIDDVALFAGQSNQLLERQRRTLTQLRDELMWSRMVPLERVLKRFPRVIRELTTTYQKPVQLKLIGTDVLVDRVMLEKLYDPLLHLLRNAFDHGIETPDERQAMGKSAEGTIAIRAYHQSNYTVIEISDDGRGLNTDRIAQRVVEAQLLSSEQVAAMPKQDIQQLIFEPGFSTASEVSELSGRGMGLDVVKESLQAFNGKLVLTTKQGQGTTFSLKVPLTLTLTKLVVGVVGTTVVALASDSIEEILRPTDAQLKQSGGKRFLYWREQLLPVYDLAELLSYQCQVPERLPQQLQTTVQVQNTMLIIQQGQERLALRIEQIVTEQELVIKPMGKAIAAPSYIQGCTVLADGSLVPVIDGAALVQFDSGQFNGGALTPAHPQQLSTQTLMIVDDSSALRRTLALTLLKAGYQVLQAKDGRDAVEQLQRGALPDLIICDVEMPRLNGFEFLSQRRAHSSWAKIPTVMLTSRGNHKHQTLAKHLGATDYFTKPYIEKEFVGAIAALLQQHP